MGTTIWTILEKMKFDFPSGQFVVEAYINKAGEFLSDEEEQSLEEIDKWDRQEYFEKNKITVTEKIVSHSWRLHKEFDDGFGGAEAPVVLAYDKSYIYVHQDYDGADYFVKVPRNPTLRNIRAIGGIPY